MPRFAYAAIDATGTSVEGVTKADTLGEARAGLLDQNLYPVKIQEKRGALDFELTKQTGQEEGADALHASARRLRQGRHSDHRGDGDHR